MKKNWLEKLAKSLISQNFFDRAFDALKKLKKYRKGVKLKKGN